MKKIIVVGLGNVAYTFVNISIARGTQAEWVFVDKNNDVAEAHAHDFEDMVSLMPRNNSTFRTGTLADAKGADIAVITASIPMKNLVDRLALAAENAKLMKSFGEGLKAANFKGTVIVASNPCDVMAACIHYTTGLPYKKIISTGTYLDSGRFKKFVAQKLNVSPDSIHGYVLGEHGKTAMIAWSNVEVGNVPFKHLLKAKKFTTADMTDILEKTIAEGLFIYNRKGNTQFGIGTAIFEIMDAVLKNKRQVMNVGVKLPRGYYKAGIYSTIPVIVGENGYEYLPGKLNMTKEEWAAFNSSSDTLAKTTKESLDLVGYPIDFE
ncbi:lactate/malate family dehydrogenase [Mycoplasma miroungirhinis]|uniref:L-lactate dehydrogenase n=1 Tax=Mycoplasma miroungirhinis TaxID=754516 RepID=A0A6M4JIE0_9MOLU|nr:L-lactate dehydrogenase [Mycoplasma miroungirhinis]QJR44241.1 L-lactate dehydrogenase [Mycoplasma miroungirhinis]